MIQIQELSKNLPASMTKVLIDFNHISRHEKSSLVGVVPIHFITRLYNVDIMVNYHSEIHNEELTDIRYYLCLGNCCETYYMEDRSEISYKPKDFSNYEVSKEDYDQFAAFRKHPMMYLKHAEGFYCSCNNNRFDFDFDNPNIMTCKKCHKRYNAGNPFDAPVLIPYRKMVNPIMELEV